MWEIMKIPFIFLWFLVLSGCFSASAEDNSEHCKTFKELDEMCGSHTFQAVKPILKYFDQLQNEQHKFENKQKEINDMQEKIQQMQLTITEGKLKDDVIVLLKSAGLSKDTHIKDLQTTISELQNINHILKQIVESLNKEIAQHKTCIKEELNKELSKIELQNTVSQYAATISELKAQIKSNDQSLKECQTKLSEKQTEVIEQQKQEVSKLNEQLVENGEISVGCINYPTSNEIHNVKIPGFHTFPALCDSVIAGQGWTVIQQRINGKESFIRSWDEYKDGFGNLRDDFFFGLEKIHRLTKHQPHELYIHMERFNGSTFHARYNNFKIAGEDDKYRLLSLGTYSGNAIEDRMRHSENHMFSTYDSDNDAHDDYDCASQYRAGWWYGSFPCSNCNLNGLYRKKEDDTFLTNFWTFYQSLKTVKILIHPAN